MTFAEADRDLFCQCGEPITLEEYRRFGLCARCPDAPPEGLEAA